MGGVGSGRKGGAQSERNGRLVRERQIFVERNDPEACLRNASLDEARATEATTDNQRRRFEVSAQRWRERAKLLTKIRTSLTLGGDRG